jgi:hypothetical protein
MVDSILVPLMGFTPRTTSQILLQSTGNTEPETDLWRQINQSLSNNLTTTVSLSEEQFQGLLNQFRTTGQGQPIPIVEVPLNLHRKQQDTPGIPIG